MSDTANAFTAYERHVHAQNEASARNKTRLFDALAGEGVTHVCASFDGEGDSGQIDNVAAYKGSELLPIPKCAVAFESVGQDGGSIRAGELSLAEGIETLCYGYLSQEHDGWEINDGAFGEFMLDVAARTVELEFNARFSEFTTSHHAF